MWIWYCLFGLLLLVVVALSVPVTGRIVYDGVLSVRIWLWGIPLTLYPYSRFKSSRPTKQAAKSPKQETQSKVKEILALLKQDDLAGTLHFLHEIAVLTTKTVGRVLRGVTAQRFDLQLLIATDDPAVTAQRYGQVCSILYPALASIESVMRIRQRHWRVEPNFLLEKSDVRFDIHLRMSLWRLLGAGIAFLWGILLLKEQDNPQMKKEVS